MKIVYANDKFIKDKPIVFLKGSITHNLEEISWRRKAYKILNGIKKDIMVFSLKDYNEVNFGTTCYTKEPEEDIALSASDVIVEWFDGKEYGSQQLARCTEAVDLFYGGNVLYGRENPIPPLDDIYNKLYQPKIYSNLEEILNEACSKAEYFYKLKSIWLSSTSIMDAIEKEKSILSWIDKHLDPLEREYWHQRLDRNCDNCSKCSCQIESYLKRGLEENGINIGALCHGWDNSKLIAKEKLKRLNSHPSLLN